MCLLNGKKMQGIPMGKSLPLFPTAMYFVIVTPMRGEYYGRVTSVEVEVSQSVTVAPTVIDFIESLMVLL